MSRLILIIVSSLLFCQCFGDWVGSCNAEETLQRIRTEVRNQSPAKKKSLHFTKPEGKRKKRSWSGVGTAVDDDDDDDWLGEMVGWAFVYCASAPYFVPRAMIGDHTFDGADFRRFPYRDGAAGLMAIGEPWTEDRYNWLTRVRADGGTDADNLSTIGGQVLFDTATRFGVDSELNYRRESRLGRAGDDLWTGDLNLLVRFAQSDRVQMRSGVGLNWLTDRFDSDFGFNFTYSGDWFPTEPWVVSTEIDWGRLGSAPLFHGRVTAGVVVRRFELFTGYDYFSIGKPDIHQWVSGIRVWY